MFQHTPATPKSPVVANSPSPDGSTKEINVNFADDRYDLANKAVSWTEIEGGFDANLTTNARCISNAFPAALCNWQYLEVAAKTAPLQASMIPPTGKAGYLLIDQMLVPFSLVEKIKNHLDGEVIEYRDTVDIEKLLGPKFIRTLSGNERKVAGPCLLHLIELGQIAIDFINREMIKEAA